ncbi:hypothetical protein P5G61_31680 [Paenibacillus sp. F6_3S_P_1C]|uniref:Uncharacterized protein n=1 Tax=Paenibacillus vandeheii TaxID=3035917 RepID=A0ABT8JMM4_9BACL|nr:hypothetical protein [Paenibacillus vandeheii]MDN4605821.1 hypothetical protein [Paenibacillus vandeheii]
MQWIMEQMAGDKDKVMSYVVARLTFSDQLEDDPDGEFPEGEEPVEGDRSEVSRC